MTRWGSRSTGSPTTSVSGISATRARIRSTRACWRALTSSRSATTAWSAAAAPSAAGTFSKPADPLVDPVVGGERVAPRTSLADQQHADAGRAAPLVRRAGGDRPAVAGGGAGPSRRRRPRRPGSPAAAPRRPAGRCRPRGWPTGARRRRARPGRLEVDAAQVVDPDRPQPAGRAARPARAGRRSARPPACATAAPGRASPSRPRCTASVPDEVNDTSSRRTPSASATASRALSRISRALRAGVCSRRGSAYPWSSAASIASRAAGCSGSEDAVSTYHARKLPVRGNPPGRFSTRAVGLGSAVS